MTLQAGTRLGPYEVLSLIGAGGMGEVYQARDTRLDRKVAVKVLAPELAADGEFRARFNREAKAISALNHPHICGLFDLGREHDTEYLVLELLEGETLAARLERGPLTVPQALRFGIEIADALEAAHSKGIIHRDLKPGNVMLTTGGVKLLDFGLAKHTVGAAGQALSTLATAPGTGTAQGTIIGTLQYMAPEQVQGQPADARTDIFALGALLHEMMTGRRAFEAATQASLIAKILETDVPAVSTLTPMAPPVFDHLVQGCLAKEPADRWHTAHDVKLQLQWIQAQGSHAAAAPLGAVPPRRRRWVPWLVVGAVVAWALVATMLLLSSRPAATQAPIQFDVVLPPAMRQSDFISAGAISPDGQRFVFEISVDGRDQLALRDVAKTELVVLSGTEGGMSPFWSTDNQSIAFFANHQLKRIPATGGPARVIADTPWVEFSMPPDGTWRGNVILFTTGGRVSRVPATGGTPITLETLPYKPGHSGYTSVQLLPDGHHLLTTLEDDPALYAASLDAPGTRKLLDEGASARYAAGHVFYLRGAGLFARPFDPERLEVSGPEIRVAERAGGFSVSDRGTVVWRPEGIALSRLTWFDRSGRQTGTVGEPGAYGQVVLSPRGRRATVVRFDAEGLTDLWDVDLASGIFSRVTTHPAHDLDPSWSPDERALAFTSYRTGRQALFVKDVVSGREEPLGTFGEPAVLDEWTRDGRFIVFRTLGKAVYAMPLGGDRTPRLLADTPYTEDEVHVSPDGRWVAFQADESGRWEIYVAAFPSFTSRRQISSGGGFQPQWRADGRELFYVSPDGTLMSVQVDARREFTVSRPAPLFTTNISPFGGGTTPQYAVTADGQRFLGLDRVGGGKAFTFLVNALNTKSADASTPAR
jgi:eukaryotic-like serine/threonine-protein kinase